MFIKKTMSEWEGLCCLLLEITIFIWNEHNSLHFISQYFIYRHVKIGRNTVLGYETQIGNNTVIEKTVIGAMTTIGSNCNIRESYIFGNCKIGNNVSIFGAVIADGVNIGNNCTIN